MAGDNRILDNTSSLIEGWFYYFTAFIDIIFKVILLIGALTSMTLLYKMFPDIAIPIYTALLPVFEIFLFIFKIMILLLLVFLLVFVYFSFEKMGNDMIKKREKRKKEFMNELIIKLKKEIKK